MGDVEALDAYRQMGQIQVPLQFLHGGHVAPFPQPPDDVLPCVLEGHVHGCQMSFVVWQRRQMSFVVRLEGGVHVLGDHLYVRGGIHGGGEPLAAQVNSGGGGNEDFRRNHGRLGVVGRKEFSQQLIRLVEADGAVVVPA